MKYSIEAALEGELYLEAPNTVVAIDGFNLRFEFGSDENARVKCVSVVLPVPPSLAESMHAT